MNKKLTNQQQRRKYNYYYNQLHNPKYTLQKNEEQKVRMYYKSGNSSMLLCKGITALAATSLSMYISSYCKKHNTKLEGNFILTH